MINTLIFCALAIPMGDGSSITANLQAIHTIAEYDGRTYVTFSEAQNRISTPVPKSEILEQVRMAASACSETVRDLTMDNLQ